MKLGKLPPIAALISMTAVTHGAVTIFSEDGSTLFKWGKDRYKPAVFEQATYDNGQRIHLGISAADSAASRPSPYTGVFYNTQGMKVGMTVDPSTYPTWTTSANLFVTADMLAGTAGEYFGSLWEHTGTDSTQATAEYYVIGLHSGASNPLDPSVTVPVLQVWDSGMGYVTFPATGVVEGWNKFDIRHGPTGIIYQVNGVPVYTDSTFNPLAIGWEIFLQGYNSGTPFDYYWDEVNVIAIHVPEPAAAVLGLLGFAGILRRRCH